MGLLSDYRKKRLERRRKREEARAEARKSLHDEPSATRHSPKKPPNPGGTFFHRPRRVPRFSLSHRPRPVPTRRIPASRLGLAALDVPLRACPQW
jgi:hypothetical protein